MSEVENNQENFAQLLEGLEKRSAKIQQGQKISGRIIAISGDDVFVDIGTKEDGVMDIHELMDKDGNIPFTSGDTIEAFVIGMSSQGVKLSKSMSGSGISALEDARDAQIPVEGKIKSQCKGGYQVEIAGKVAFCPGSQIVSSKSGDDLIGWQTKFLVTRIENNGRNIVVSQRALQDKERRENLEKLLDTVKQGDVVEGIVSRLAPFGVFVELAPGVEGMVHLSELAWNHVQKPEDAVSEGEKISVKLLSTDTDDKGRTRISLSRRQAIEDPWINIDNTLHTGDTVTGTVKRLAPFGAFVEILPGVEGLVHLSEMSWEKRVNKPEEVTNIDERVLVKVKDINKEGKRISLSMRDAQGDPWDGVEERFSEGVKITGKIESKSPHGYFIQLVPGITGLLPMSSIKNAEKTQQLDKLTPGDTINVIVQKVDSTAKRISLMPESQEIEEVSWKENVKPIPASPEEGIMAQAFKKALQKKRQGE